MNRGTGITRCPKMRLLKKVLPGIYNTLNIAAAGIFRSSLRKKCKKGKSEFRRSTNVRAERRRRMLTAGFVIRYSLLVIRSLPTTDCRLCYSLLDVRTDCRCLLPTADCRCRLPLPTAY